MANRNYPKNVAATTVIPFDNPVTYIPPKTITGATTFTKNTAAAQAGYAAIVRVTANGSNTPDLSAFKLIGTGTWDNTNGVVNQLWFVYDGTDYCVAITHPATIGGGGGDTTAPTVIGMVATDATHIVVTFSESVTAPSVSGWSFKKNGSSLSASSVSLIAAGVWSFVVATMASGDTLLASYNSGVGAVQDSSGNPLASFTDSSVTNSIGAVTLNAPTGVTLGSATSTTQPLTWTDTNSSPNESGYKVYRNTVNTFGTATLVTTTAANATSYTVTGLTASTLYYYWVVAAGNGTTTLDSSASTVASGSTSGAGYDADAVTVINAIEATDAGALSTGQKNAINARILALKAQSKWANMVAYYGYVGGTAASHAINWKTPGTYNITWNGGITHSATGVLFDGSTGYGDTGINDNTVMNLDTFSIGGYSRTNTNNGFMMGILQTNGVYLADRNSMIVRMHDVADLTSAMTPTRTLMATRQVSAPKLAEYRDVSQLTVDAGAALGKINGNIYVGAINNLNTPGPGGFSDKSYGSMFISNDGFTSSEEATFGTDETTFQTALTRNV
jgi:hypothetical protein